MRIGTRSLLFGVHQVFIHPFFVAEAWRRLYGFPKSFPLWVAFFVHDWGYWNKPNTDGIEGETHPELGGRIMSRLFGEDWGDFTILHSRHYAKARGRNFSQLCVADKLASIIYPSWLYLGLAKLSGEIESYRQPEGWREGSQWLEMTEKAQSDAEWFDCLIQYLRDWVNQNKDKGDGIPSTKRGYYV